ncbi:ribose ABC transporter permease [Fodinisporobacter ferrooxydans]|uniref:Ribose ABC transporter permease n=1 Tax=Fodinisporobacter ferrooxydans TaxID=2901836 RepID=A0ABY4CIT0_9BACL|nr:ribose ABC transporter permease [Alicyclobacillaceae bacterium MYW30-H2]
MEVVQEKSKNLNTKLESGVRLKNFFFNYGIIFAFIFLFVILSILSNSFLTFENIINVLRQISINAILAIGATFVILTAGIDLSVGSIVALAGIVTATFAQSGHSNLIISIVMGLAVGLFVGFINGFVTAKWKVAPFITTLGMMAVARGATFVYTGGQPVANLSQSFLQIGGGDIAKIPLPVIITVVVSIIFMVLLYKTKFGRYVYAIGGNENAAKISGIKVDKVKIWVYSISGLLAGLAGIILTSRVSSGLPQAGDGYELDAIAAVVIGGTSLMGGKGRLWGSLIGALLIGVLNNGLDLLNVSSYWQQIVKGCIIVAAVMIERKK